jgi:pimeloyl-ACP methyl ester carboxylesterase
VVFEELSKHFTVISFDQRGYGKSDRPLEKYSLDLWTDDTSGLLDALGVSRAHVFGTSVGGVLALKFAAKYPEKTISCVADVPIAKPDYLRRVMFGNWRKLAQLIGIGELYADIILTYNVGAKILESNDGEKIRRSLVELLSGIPVETVVQVCTVMENLDLREDLPKIKVPTLVMCTEGDIVSPMDMEGSGMGGRKVAEMVPNATLKIWKGIGHADLIEIPKESVLYVVDFLKASAR